MVSGFVICGFGFGGFFFGILSQYLCNPNDVRPKLLMTSLGPENLFGKEVAERVPSMLRSLCLVWVALFTFGLFTITKYQRSTTSPESSDEPSSDDEGFG
jgi:hypothetical protein